MLLLPQESSFDPDYNLPNGKTYKEERYVQIMEEQVAISYASRGISIADTDEMSPFDRKLVLNTIRKIKDNEHEQIERARASRNTGSTTSRQASRYSSKRR